MKTRRSTGQAGNTLVVAMMLVMVVGGFIAGAAAFTQTIGRNVSRSQTLITGREVAEGCLELAFTSWRQVCRRNIVAPPTNFDLAGIPVPTAADFPNIPGLVIKTYHVRPVTPTWQPITATSTRPAGVLGQNAATISFFYEAEAEVELNGIHGKQTAHLKRIFEKQNISPWAFAIFYNDLLEMHPGPPQIVNGAVHTNGSLYTAHNSLEFQGKTTFVGQWEIAFAPGDTTHTGSISSPNWPSNLPPARDVPLQLFGFDPATIFSTTDGNQNNDGYREYIERPATGSSNPDPIAEQRYYNQADIKVEVNASNVLTVRKRDGSTLSGTTGPQADRDLYNAIVGAITTNQTIQDNREAAQVRLVTLDVSLLKAAQTSGAITPSFNGVIYLADTSAGASGASPKRGVRLKNGGKLPNGGLTVVSENPIYIQGDYNTGTNTDGSNQPASNTGTDTQPTSGSYVRQPAAVIADAVNVLSNAWTDANSGNSLSSRVASPTTVNTAIMSGIVPTGNGVSYSGGVENFPRFLENWTSKRFTYYGSMVEMYKSQQSIGQWGMGNVYNAPNRRWFFDTKFYTDPPPGSFIITKFERHQWSIQ